MLGDAVLCLFLLVFLCSMPILRIKIMLFMILIFQSLICLVIYLDIQKEIYD